MAPLGLTLAVVLAQSGRIAVLSIVADDRADAPPVTTLSSELRSEGLTLVTGPALRDRLFGDGKALGHELSRTIEQEIAAAQSGYDRGDFSLSARQAALAFEALSHAAPSLRREVLTPALQILWGASLLQLKEHPAAALHFRDALQRNPQLVVDQDRFAPPVQRAIEEERLRVTRGPQVSLEVSGTAGATLFVDGVARGVLPLQLAIAPHRCTFWVEVSGESGLAHERLVAGTTALAIDWQLEVASRFNAGEWAIELPAAEAGRRAMVKRILKSVSAAELLTLEWVVATPDSPRRLALVRYGSEGSVQNRQILPTDGVDWRMAVRAVREGGPLVPNALSASAVPRSIAEAPVAASARASDAKHFPWLATGLIAGGVVLVAGAVALGVSLHSTNAVFLGPETPRP